MTSRNSRAGGVFLVIAIFVGLVWGIAAGNPMQGIIFGTVAGVALAVAVWLMDRRRS
jgi:hypothetical protein